jgi:hypothetical protein
MVERDQDMGASVPDQALVSDQAAARLDPPGFDPSRDELPNDLDRERYEGKPRHLARDEKAALELFVDVIKLRLSEMPDSELSAVVRGCLNVSPINCWCWTYAFADVVYPFAAEEIERRRDSDGSGEAGETGTGSTEGDSAGRNGIAQPSSPSPKGQVDHPTSKGAVSHD